MQFSSNDLKMAPIESKIVSNHHKEITWKTFAGELVMSKQSTIKMKDTRSESQQGSGGSKPSQISQFYRRIW
jgi:hypothetical protein